MSRFYLVVLTCATLIASLFVPRLSNAQALGDLTDRVVSLSDPQTEQAGKQVELVFRSARVPDAYNGIALQGFSSTSNLKGWVRFQEPSGWSPWHELYIVRSATDDAFMAGYRSETIRAGQPFELRFSVDASASLDLIGAGVFDTRQDADRVTAPEGESRSARKTADFVIVPPMLNARTAWGAEPFIRGTPEPLNQPSYESIAFHHAAGFGATTREEGLQQVKNIQDLHQNVRGWSDIGYHFVLDQSGRLYQGRPFLNDQTPFREGPPLVQGAHVGGHNEGNIGVCVLGCYDPKSSTASFPCEDQLSDAMFDSLATTFAFLSERYGVSPDNIIPHRNFSGASTACPGDNNMQRLADIHARVRELLETGNQPLGSATLAAEPTDDGVVRLSWSFLEDLGIDGYRIERVQHDTETTIFEAAGTAPDEVVDAQVGQAGAVTYRLVARNNAGRTQILATAQLRLEAPSTYRLSDNFPNPFRHQTTIRYFLERDGIVHLSVYTLTGQQVTTLREEHQDGGRWYNATFDASGLASGTYYYRIEVEGFSGTEYAETKPFVVVR